MSSVGTAPRAAVPTSNARAEASRRNGAKSRGPSTPEGKARSAQNALKHGLRAQKHLVLPDEDAGEFRALAAALIEELAPAGALQSVLAQRVAIAAWRLARADRIETELLVQRGDRDLGIALTRDGHGARAFPTLLRYRGTAMAEFIALPARAQGAPGREGGSDQVAGRAAGQVGTDRPDIAGADLGPAYAKPTRAAPQPERTRAYSASKRTQAAAACDSTRRDRKPPEPSACRDPNEPDATRSERRTKRGAANWAVHSVAAGAASSG